MKTLALCAALILGCSLAPGQEPKPAPDNTAPPPPDIRRINITVFPHEVIIVRGEMVELAALREHLEKLVPDAKKPGVEVIVNPNSPKEMDLVPKIIQAAKDAGYTNVSYNSAKLEKPVITEISILLSRTGDIFVGDSGVAEKDLKAHLQKLVEEERRTKVTVYIRASRLVLPRKIADVSKVVKDAGFKDLVFGVIAE
jgi:biopolymer transport protein ExbD